MFDIIKDYPHLEEKMKMPATLFVHPEYFGIVTIPVRILTKAQFDAGEVGGVWRDNTTGKLIFKE